MMDLPAATNKEFTQDRLDELQESNPGTVALFLLFIPHSCFSEKKCRDFHEFWDMVVQAFPGHAFFKHCSSVANDGTCGPEVKIPIVWEWDSSVGRFAQYTGPRSLEDVLARVKHEVQRVRRTSPVSAQVTPTISKEVNMYIIDSEAVQGRSTENDVDSVSWPTQIHRTYKTSDEEKWLPVWRLADTSWIERYPDHTHRFWSDQSIDSLLRTEFPEYLPFWDGLDCHEFSGIIRADFSMLMFMYLFGGIYHDLDVAPTGRHFSELRSSHPEAIVMFGRALPDPYFYVEKEIVITTTPRHAFWRFCMDRIGLDPTRESNCQKTVNHIAGTNMLGDLIKAFWRLPTSGRGRSEVVLLPPHIFYPLEAALYSAVSGGEIGAKVAANRDNLPPDLELPEQYKPLDQCLAFQLVIVRGAIDHLNERTRQLLLGQPRCEDLSQLAASFNEIIFPHFFRMELPRALDRCYGGLWDGCLQAANNIGAFTVSMSTGSWSSTCAHEVGLDWGRHNDPATLMALREACEEQFRSVNMPRAQLILGVSTNIDQALRVTDSIGDPSAVVALCVSLFSRLARKVTYEMRPNEEFAKERRWQGVMQWPLYESAGKCAQYLEKKIGHALPTFVEVWRNIISGYLSGDRAGKGRPLQ